MNVEYYNAISDKLSESTTTTKKDTNTVNIVKDVFTEELNKRNIKYNKDVVDIYPHCLKVEKETLDFPHYRDAVEATRQKMREDYGIELDLFSF